MLIANLLGCLFFLRRLFVSTLSLERHADVNTTMIYTHVLNKGGRGVISPADG
jgi:hypothetical protein